MFILILCPVVAAVLFFVLIAAPKGGDITVTVDGKLYGSYEPSTDRVVLIEEMGHMNELTIKNGEAKMTKANCPGGQCLREPTIRDGRGAIICLPNRVAVRFDTADGADLEVK